MSAEFVELIATTEPIDQTPAVIASALGDTGITPSSGTRPMLGLKPTMPQNAAGRIVEPTVCVPSASGSLLMA